MLRIGRVGVEPTYEHLIRVSDATGLPYAPILGGIFQPPYN